MTYGEYLRHIRNRRCLSIKEAAGLIGISGQYLSEIERGGRKPLTEEKAAKMMEAYYLTDEEGKELQSLISEYETMGLMMKDINTYIRNNPYIIDELRMAMENNLTIRAVRP